MPLNFVPLTSWQKRNECVRFTGKCSYLPFYITHLNINHAEGRVEMQQRKPHKSLNKNYNQPQSNKHRKNYRGRTSLKSTPKKMQRGTHLNKSNGVQNSNRGDISFKTGGSKHQSEIDERTKSLLIYCGIGLFFSCILWVTGVPKPVFWIFIIFIFILLSVAFILPKGKVYEKLVDNAGLIILGAVFIVILGFSNGDFLALVNPIIVEIFENISAVFSL
jgi:hypothetical protein